MVMRTPFHRAEQPRLLMPEAPALVAGPATAAWVGIDGEVEALALASAARRARQARPVLCHLPATARRLDVEPFAALDVLELFAFVRPTGFCAPTPRGLASALGLARPQDLDGEAALLLEASRLLLAELAARDRSRERDGADIAQIMGAAGWPWAAAVLAALGIGPEVLTQPRPALGLRVWERLTPWSEQAPLPPAGHRPVAPAAARSRLAELLGTDAEDRPQQADYASAACGAFAPRDAAGVPAVVLAEAGTGVGKTVGYIAPASLWAEDNKATVWISTFTRNLQHQIDDELDRLYPEPARKRRRAVIRKGRENYLCLLNMEEAVRGTAGRDRDTVALGLVARWAARSRDGDMVGGDFPAWLAELFGPRATLALTDRRGECLYSACAHYRKCTIERSVRQARRAELVIANHALVMLQAALGGIGDGALPLRYVFDEGHHVFDAADSVFAAHLSGRETRELRRWLLGAEGGRGGAGRARGLARRLEGLAELANDIAGPLDETLGAARGLAAQGWLGRLADGNPQGPAERFLLLVRQQTYARVQSSGDPYSLETDPQPPVPGLVAAARDLDAALARLEVPVGALGRALARLLDDRADELDSDTRRRIEAAVRSLERRAAGPVKAWRAMLASLETETPDEFVDWFAVERIMGRDSDVGMFRHWVDPTRPFMEALVATAHGALFTSATLTDGTGDPEADWRAAEARTGAVHLPAPAVRARVPSPFDYAANTRVFIVNDIAKTAPDQIAAGFRALFLAAGGGALGLFTAIARLRAVHGRIAPALGEAGLPLYAQHVDAMNLSSLIDIFREDENACLLGTDAVRDGVDVPGRSLRLIVFDRVPWPRPDIAHRARRQRFGGSAYDDMLTRLRLKQAFGRLVRRADDRGVFVLLDRMMPSRLLGAFPPEVAVERTGLAHAVAATRDFLTTPPGG
jgi:ATP-dependent DNA helicase DinG